MTLSDLQHRFQGHDIIQRQITRKWYKTELYLQWPTNRKSYNGAIFSDLEQPIIEFSRSHYFLMLNISQTAKDTAIVASKCEWESVSKLSNGAIFNDLERPQTQVSRSHH